MTVTTLVPPPPRPAVPPFASGTQLVVRPPTPARSVEVPVRAATISKPYPRVTPRNDFLWLDIWTIPLGRSGAFQLGWRVTSDYFLDLCVTVETHPDIYKPEDLTWLASCQTCLRYMKRDS